MNKQSHFITAVKCGCVVSLPQSSEWLSVKWLPVTDELGGSGVRHTNDILWSTDDA